MRCLLGMSFANRLPLRACTRRLCELFMLVKNVKLIYYYSNILTQRTRDPTQYTIMQNLFFMNRTIQRNQNQIVLQRLTQPQPQPQEQLQPQPQPPPSPKIGDNYQIR